MLQHRVDLLLEDCHEDFPYGDAAWLIEQEYLRKPRPFKNETGTKCDCGQPYLKHGSHCALCHSSFVQDEALIAHLSDEGCEAPELGDKYTLTPWGGYRLSQDIPEGLAWMLNGELVAERHVPWVADYVEPIPMDGSGDGGAAQMPVPKDAMS